MNDVARLTTRFSVEVITLNKDTVITQTSHPDISFTFKDQLNTLAYVQPTNTWPHVDTLVLCEYSKFRIKSNSYFSIRFDSKRAQLFEIFEYLPSPISYLFNRMMPIFTLATTPSNQQYQQTCSTETPTTEFTIVRCHKNSWIYLTSTYYWWLLRPTITIWFDSKWKKTLFTHH